eukprot:8101825-Pyramimonas_sp.AAC.1
MTFGLGRNCCFRVPLSRQSSNVLLPLLCRVLVGGSSGPEPARSVAVVLCSLSWVGTLCIIDSGKPRSA